MDIDVSMLYLWTMDVHSSIFKWIEFFWHGCYHGHCMNTSTRVLTFPLSCNIFLRFSWRHGRTRYFSSQLPWKMVSDDHFTFRSWGFLTIRVLLLLDEILQRKLLQEYSKWLLLCLTTFPFATEPAKYDYRPPTPTAILKMRFFGKLMTSRASRTL